MRKLLSLGCVLTLTATFGFSEVAAQPGFGLRGGLNLANLNDVDNMESRTGFMAGAEAEISKFNVGERYGTGLTEISEDGNNGKNGVFSIVAGIRF